MRYSSLSDALWYFEALDFHTPPKQVMFDLDGTLVDSAYYIAAALDKVLSANGLPLAGESRIRQWVGNGAERLMRRALVWVRYADVDTLSPEYYEDHTDRFPETES